MILLCNVFYAADAQPKPSTYLLKHIALNFAVLRKPTNYAVVCNVLGIHLPTCLHDNHGCN